MFKKPKNESLSADQMMAEFLDKKKETKSKDRLAELEVKFSALCKLLEDKLGLTEQDIENQISIFEEEKKKKAEEVKKENCPKCQRPVSIKTGICIYCGKD